VPVCDLVCALYGALAAVAALRARERDGKGQFIDVCLFEAGVSLAVWEAGRYFATGEVPGPLGSAHQTSAPYQALRSSDGYVTVGATSPRNWTAFCRVLGLDELESDPRYQDNEGRHSRRSELIPAIEAVTATRPTAYWVDALQEAGVPCGAIQTYDQVFNDPHLLARNFFPRVPHPTLGQVEQIGSPMRMGETPVRMERAGPRLGEHGPQVLAELGLSPDEIEALQEQGVVARP
jgi:formyl-CoA transferase